MNKDLYAFCLSVLLIASTNLNAQFKDVKSMYMDGAVQTQIVDVDLDGFQDVLVGTRNGTILLKNHYGDIYAEDPIRLNYNDEVVLSLDIDQDGYPDILTASSVREGVRWMHNQGNGTFSVEKELISSGLVKHLVAADIDSDGDQDLVLNTNDQGIVFRRNNGNGDFGKHRIYERTTASKEPVLMDMDSDAVLFSNGSSILADVDGDGLNDLISIDFEHRYIVWQKCLGSAHTFADKQKITTGIRQNGSLYAIDMEADGDLDLVFASDVYDEILWIENGNGKADFKTPQVVVDDVIDPTFIAFADFDLDGDQDIISGSDDARSFLCVESDMQFEDMIMGQVYNDVDGNGKFNAGDHGLANHTVGISDGRTTYTDNNGFYTFPATEGEYAVSIQEQQDWVLTTGGLSKSVAMLAPRSSSLGNDFGFNAKDERAAVKASLATSATRCGLVSPYWVTVTNTGTVSGEVTAHLQFDSKDTYVWAELEPSTVIGQTLTWELGPLQPTEKRSFKVFLASTEETRTGDKLSQILTASVQRGRAEAVHTTDSLVRIVDCDMAANVLQASPRGYGTEKAIPWSQALTYTASFQNTTGDRVQHMFVEDTLDEWMDISTFEVLASSHDYRVYVNPNGVIQFYFEDIELLDASKDGLQSQAFVSYRVKPLSWVPHNTEISNQAHFFFGPEHMESSNIVRNVVGESITLGAQQWDALSETNIVYPNPTNGPTTFDLINYKYDRVEIHLIDATGRVIFKREMRGGSKHLFQLGALRKGNYLVRALPLETGKAELLTKLVIQ